MVSINFSRTVHRSKIVYHCFWTMDASSQNQPQGRPCIVPTYTLFLPATTFRYPFRRTIALWYESSKGFHLFEEDLSNLIKLTSWTITSIAVLITLPANTTVLAWTWIARDVFTFAIMSSVTFVASAPVKKNSNLYL